MSLWNNVREYVRIKLGRLPAPTAEVDLYRHHSGPVVSFAQLAEAILDIVDGDVRFEPTRAIIHHQLAYTYARRPHLSVHGIVDVNIRYNRDETLVDLTVSETPIDVVIKDQLTLPKVANPDHPDLLRRTKFTFIATDAVLEIEGADLAGGYHAARYGLHRDPDGTITTSSGQLVDGDWALPGTCTALASAARSVDDAASIEARDPEVYMIYDSITRAAPEFMYFRPMFDALKNDPNYGSYIYAALSHEEDVHLDLKVWDTKHAHAHVSIQVDDLSTVYFDPDTGAFNKHPLNTYGTLAVRYSITVGIDSMSINQIED